MTSVTSFFGIIFGLGLMLAAIVASKADYHIYLDWQSAMIVFGGTIAATLTSFHIREVFRGVLSFLIVFRSKDVDFMKAIEEIAEIATNYAKGGAAYLDERLKKMKESPLKDGLNLFVNGYKPEDIRLIMEENNKIRYEREQGQVMLFRVMAKVSPAFGMIGTMIGLVNMLKNMGSDPKSIGPQMAIALITTFYGLVLANLIFNPVAEKISAKADVNFLYGNILTEGLALIIEKRHQVYVKDRLACYLPPRQRVKLYMEKAKTNAVKK